MIRIISPFWKFQFRYNDWEIEIGGTTYPIEWIFYGIFELEDNLFPTTFIQCDIFVVAAQKRQSTIYCVSDFQFSAYFHCRNKIRTQRNRFVTAYYIANIWPTLSLSKTTFSTAKTGKNIPSKITFLFVFSKLLF